MKPEEKKSEQKNCGNEACECSSVVSDAALKNKSEEKIEVVKNELDPTHFGDWQVNCRTIDF